MPSRPAWPAHPPGKCCLLSVCSCPGVPVEAWQLSVWLCQGAGVRGLQASSCLGVLDVWTAQPLNLKAVGLVDGVVVPAYLLPLAPQGQGSEPLGPFFSGEGEGQSGDWGAPECLLPPAGGWHPSDGDSMTWCSGWTPVQVSRRLLGVGQVCPVAFRAVDASQGRAPAQPLIL